MSNVVSPRGPLPPRVYWRRRLVLVAVVTGVVLLVGRLLTGGDTGGDAEAAADRGRATTTPTAAPAKKAAKSPAAARASHRPRQRAAKRADPARGTAARRRAAALRGPTGPLAQPAGPCRAAEVAIVPDVEDTDAYGSVPLRLGVSATGGRACTFTFGPDSVALQVTSGDDLIWESMSCRSALEEQSLVVRPGWLGYVTVDWSGRRGSEGCGDGGDFAEPGYYWAEAAAVGGEPARSQFELETPPEPTRKPPKRPAQSSPKPGEGSPSAEPSAEPADGTTRDRRAGDAPTGRQTPRRGGGADPTTEPTHSRG